MFAQPVLRVQLETATRYRRKLDEAMRADASIELSRARPQTAPAAATLLTRSTRAALREQAAQDLGLPVLTNYAQTPHGAPAAEHASLSLRATQLELEKEELTTAVQAARTRRREFLQERQRRRDEEESKRAAAREANRLQAVADDVVERDVRAEVDAMCAAARSRRAERRRRGYDTRSTFVSRFKSEWQSESDAAGVLPIQVKSANLERQQELVLLEMRTAALRRCEADEERLRKDACDRSLRAMTTLRTVCVCSAAEARCRATIAHSERTAWSRFVAHATGTLGAMVSDSVADDALQGYKSFRRAVHSSAVDDGCTQQQARAALKQQSNRLDRSRTAAFRAALQRESARNDELVRLHAERAACHDELHRIRDGDACGSVGRTQATLHRQRVGYAEANLERVEARIAQLRAEG